MIQIRNTAMLMIMAAFMASAMPAFSADNAKPVSYNEDQFLNAFSGKSRKVILEKLGVPAKKEQSVKPSNAMTVIGPKIAGAAGADSQKPVNVEMWYYNDLVHYEPKKKYKVTELTFVNDRCMNIAFFNNK